MPMNQTTHTIIAIAVASLLVLPAAYAQTPSLSVSSFTRRLEAEGEHSPRHELDAFRRHEKIDG